MKWILVAVPLAFAACASPPLDTRANLASLSGSGQPDAATCGCPPGTELRIDDQGGASCVVPDCTTDADCPQGTTCSAETCVQRPCTTDSQCAAPQVCVEGACVQPACDDCPAGYHCVVGAFPDGDHVCAADACAHDADCPSGLICQGGTCVTDTQFCNADADCPSGHCWAVADVPPDADCDGACPATVGICVPPDGCQSDADCPQGQRCDLTTCTADPGPCTTDADCGGGWCHVESGTCVAPGGCVDDATCPPGESCLAGTCGTASGCSHDDECGDGLRCVDGVCTECTAETCAPPPGGGSDAGVPDGGPYGGGGYGGDAGGSDGGPYGGGGYGGSGPVTCAPGCGQRTGYHLYCPTSGLSTLSWCPEQPSCGAMDACQASQLASCNAGCPGGCQTIFDGPVSCCDCAIARDGGVL